MHSAAIMAVDRVGRDENSTVEFFNTKRTDASLRTLSIPPENHPHPQSSPRVKQLGLIQH